MPELAIMPPSPNKPPGASGKKPAVPQSVKRFSIKDYFSVMDPPSSASTSTAAAQGASKKRKSTDASAVPVAKKPKKPTGTTTTKPKKAAVGDSIVVAGSSDKENGINAETPLISEIETPSSTAAPAKPKAVRKPKAPKDVDGTAAAAAAVPPPPPPPPPKKKDKGKGIADQVAEDAAFAEQLAREEATAANIRAPTQNMFTAINVVRPKEGIIPISFKAVNPVVEAMKVKAAEMSKGPEKKHQKEPKVPKEPKKPKQPQTNASKESVPKAPKEPKAPKVTKEKIEKIPKTNTQTKEKKVKPPKTDQSAEKSKKSSKPAKDGTEIKEWKQYEPKPVFSESSTPALVPGIAKFLQPVEAMRAPPKLVPCPELEHIEISYPLSVVHDRLIIREFFLRFEKSIKIVPKYINIVNNPNSDWTDLTYRSLVLAVLRLLHADDYPEIEWDVLDRGIKELEKVAPEDPKLWIHLSDILEGFIDDEKYVDADWTQDKTRLELIVKLIGIAMGCSIIREKLDLDLANIKKEEKSCQEQIKTIRTEWDAAKQEISKARLTVAPEEKEKLEKKYQTEQAFMRSQISLLESRSWFKKRKMQPRHRPLGVDAKGNTYWLFIQRDKNAEDWGRWIVIERAIDLPHPSGSIPPSVLTPPSPPAENGDNGSLETPVTEEDVKKRVWYAISTSGEAAALVKWIKYTAEMVFYERATKAAVTAAATALGETSPKRQRLQAVEVPMSPGMQKVIQRDPGEARRLGVVVKGSEKIEARDEVTKERIDALCKSVKMIGGFWELEEEGVGRLV